jgi:integrase
MKGVFERQPGSNVWWIRYGDGSKFPSGQSRIRYEKCGSKSVAEKTLIQRKRDVLMGVKLPADHPKTLIADLAELVMEKYRDRNQRTIDVESRLRLHVLPHFGGIVASDLSTDQIGSYKAKRRKAGAANATINRELAALKLMLRLGHNHEPRSVDAVPAITLLAEDNTRTGFVVEDQYKEMMRLAKPWLRAPLAVGYTFGLRKAEITNLRVRQVDLHNRTIRLDPGDTKSGKGRVIPLTNEVINLIVPCLQGKRPDDHVFTKAGKPIGDFRKTWAGLCRKAGMPGVLFHDLRRSAIRNMVSNGISDKVGMSISGHETRSVFDRYNIVSEQDLRAAAEKLERSPSPTESKTESRKKSASVVVMQKRAKYA